MNPVIKAAALLWLWVAVGCSPGSVSAWGPLAVTPTNSGMEARNEGRLVLTDRCAFLEREGERELLVWPASQTSWSWATMEISFRRSNGDVMILRDGQSVVLGGGGSSRAEDGLSGEEWVSRNLWVTAPDPRCIVDVRWLVSDVLAE